MGEGFFNPSSYLYRLWERFISKRNDFSLITLIMCVREKVEYIGRTLGAQY